MNGSQITGTNPFSDISYPELTQARSLQDPVASFMCPDEVVSDLKLTHAEKREILASWASDIRAVPDAPALRQLDNGAVVRIDDVLRALNSLNEGKASEHTMFAPSRSWPGLRIRPPFRLRLRRGWPDDDDDPPPCPAMVVRPLGGPPFGGETSDLGLVLAA